MGILSDHGIAEVRHYSPLHYLPFIARFRSIMCKPSLAAAGFNPSHYRSMSHGQDVARGFGSYLHLALDPKPPILKDKLKYGFPHVAIAVPVTAVDAAATSLCRFNVAMTRKLKRDGKPGHAESDRNGRYYAGHEIPIGRSPAEKRAMLALNTKTMIEVLVHGDLLLPDDTKIICYSSQDCAAAQNILARLGCPWNVEVATAPGHYSRNPVHSESVADFVAQSLADENWRGNGLEFDNLRRNARLSALEKLCSG